MKIAIIGAGFTGLAAAYELTIAGHEVVIFEKSILPGGLASGFFDEGWAWPLEHHYHHVFETDNELKNWLTKLNLIDRLFYLSTKSYTYIENGMFPLDSALSLMSFPGFSFLGKLRTGLTLAFFKFLPWGEKLEKYTASSFIQKTMGEESWKLLWQPLFEGKFGTRLANEINASWFWARIATRSKKLGYFEEGFLGLATKIIEQLQEQGVAFKFETTVNKLKKSDNKLELFIEQEDKSSELFDKVIFTGHSQQLLDLVNDEFPDDFVRQLSQLESLAAMTMVLVLDKPFFDQDIYWLNINRKDWPFLALVEHTNYISKSYYADQHLIYIAKYLDSEDGFFNLDKEQLLAKYDPYLTQVNPKYKESLKDVFLFKSKYAQPVVKKFHSKQLPTVETPLTGLYFAGMEHIYPFDRGINYAVKLGRETAQKVLSHN